MEADMTIAPIGNQPAGALLGSTPGIDFKQRMQPVADLFKMSSDDLMSELKSGKSLADIAQEKGVSRDDLINAVKQGLSQNGNVDASKLDEIANRIVDHKPGAHGAHGHHHHHGGGNSTDPDNSVQPYTPNTTAGVDTLA
jgi:hypothetical protein